MVLKDKPLPYDIDYSVTESENFNKIMIKSLLNNHNLKMGENINIAEILTENCKSENNDVDCKKIAWILHYQTEYSFMKLLPNKYFPIIYGNCGSLYALEKTILPHYFTTNIRDRIKDAFNHFVTNNELIERLKIAEQFLDMADFLKFNFSEELHLCDIKFDNFGIVYPNNGGIQLKIIDLDSAFLSTKLYDTFEMIDCRNNGQCKLFDCLGYCDKQTGKCRRIRRNDNLQTICLKIFLSHSSNLYSGLLNTKRRNVKSILKIVNVCSTSLVTSKLQYQLRNAINNLLNELESETS